MPLLKLDSPAGDPAAVTATHLWYSRGPGLRRCCLVTYADELVRTFPATIVGIRADATRCFVATRFFVAAHGFVGFRVTLWSNDFAPIADNVSKWFLTPNRIVFKVNENLMSWEIGSAVITRLVVGNVRMLLGASHRRVIYQDRNFLMRWQDGALAIGVQHLSPNDAVRYLHRNEIFNDGEMGRLAADYVQPPDEPGIAIPHPPYRIVFINNYVHIRCESRAAARIQVLLREDPALAARVGKFV